MNDPLGTEPHVCTVSFAVTCELEMDTPNPTGEVLKESLEYEGYENVKVEVVNVDRT